MNDRLSAQEGAVGLEPEACKKVRLIRAAGVLPLGSRIFRFGKSGRKRFLPTQRISLEVPVNLLAHVLPTVQDEWQLPRGTAWLASEEELRCIRQEKSCLRLPRGMTSLS
jgi:hypothetical protein